MSQTPTVPLSLYFRFEHNHCTASLGIGGYYKRGYRTHISKAPIRETLAAAIDFNALLSSPSNNNITLLDPFCGSGTLLQEAWSFADGDWPYLQCKRLMPDYVDMLIPSFELTNSSSLLSSSPPDNTNSNCWNEWRKARFVGSDVDAACIRAAKENFAHLHSTPLINIMQSNFYDFREQVKQFGKIVLVSNVMNHFF